MSSLVYAVCGGEVILLGIANVCAFVPTILRVFILKNVDSLHRDPVSDIPGNPHAFSPAIISLFRTLPEPSNFNIVWTGLTLTEPLLIRGDLPLSRFSSLSVYGAGSSETPNSAELNATENSRSCNILILPEGVESPKGHTGAVVVRSNQWKKGFIAMRNYLVPPGTRVTTPHIVRLSDGEVIRPSADLVAGPCAMDVRTPKILEHSLVALQLNAVAFAFNYFIFNETLVLPVQFLILLVGAVVGFCFYRVCFILGKKRLTQLTKDICRSQNEFYYASLEQGSKTSQPSKLHKYWMMCHDIPPGQEVIVKVTINSAFQKYWSLVVYDEFGLPLPQYVYDGNCLTTAVQNGKNKGKTSSKATRGAGEGSGEEDGEVYEVDIRLRNGQSKGNSDADNCVNVNVVDVADCAQGYVLFRVNHPVGEHVVDFSNPIAKLSVSAEK